MPKFSKKSSGQYTAKVGDRLYRLKDCGALGWQLVWSDAERFEVFVDFAKTIKASNETLAFVLAAAELLREIGAEERGGYWHLETALGPLHIRPRGSGVFLRFQGDLVAARQHFGRDGSLNPYSGKWNLTWYGDPIGLQDKVRALELHLGRLPVGDQDRAEKEDTCQHS
jgi:hypothetical protein